MPQRGTYGFLVADNGDLLDRAENVETLRRLWLNRQVVNEVGPGVNDEGTWHVACHLAAGGCVRQTEDGRLLWLEISHRGQPDLYYASLTWDNAGRVTTLDLKSDEARQLMRGSKLLGFVEGTSRGRISAVNANDPAERWNNWPRQPYNQPPEADDASGGRVWEHWCTTRDIRGQDEICNSVLEGYVTLVAAAGDLFAPTVARGRTSYGHPEQRNAMIAAGFTTEQSASWRTTPVEISREVELLLRKATPAAGLAAAARLEWPGNEPRYYMFHRKIGDWSERN
jgi:hypothetical protein